MIQLSITVNPCDSVFSVMAAPIASLFFNELSDANILKQYVLKTP